MHNCSFSYLFQWHNNMVLKTKCKDENASIPTNNKTCQTQHGMQHYIRRCRHRTNLNN